MQIDRPVIFANSSYRRFRVVARTSSTTMESTWRGDTRFTSAPCIAVEVIEEGTPNTRSRPSSSTSTLRVDSPWTPPATMSRYNVNEEYDLENRREVTLTGFSSNALDDVLRSSGGNNNEPALNGNSAGIIAGAHAITKDAKVVNLEGEFYRRR